MSSGNLEILTSIFINHVKVPTYTKRRVKYLNVDYFKMKLFLERFLFHLFPFIYMYIL